MPSICIFVCQSCIAAAANQRLSNKNNNIELVPMKLCFGSKLAGCSDAIYVH